jgi:hypothetical protein
MGMQLISHGEDLATFGYNRDILDQIMVEARDLLDRGDFAAAMERYADGLELCRDEFFSMDYNGSVKTRVRFYLQTLTAGIEDCIALIEPFKNALAGIGSVPLTGGADSLALLWDCYARLSPLMGRLIAAENALAEAGNYFDEQSVLFRQEYPGMEDHLAFASRFIHGRWNADIHEGLLGSIAKLWGSVLSQFEVCLNAAAELAYQNAYAAQESRNFSRNREQFELAAAYCDLAMEYFDDWRRFYRGQNFQTYDYFGDTVIVFKAEDYLRCYSMKLAALSQKEAGPLLEQYRRLAAAHPTALELWRQGRIDAQTAIAQESQARGSCRDFALRVEAVLERLNADGEAILQGRYDLARKREHFPPMKNALALFENMDANIFILENAAAIREYTIANGDLQGRITKWKDLFAEANRYFAGIFRSNADEAPAARYPREALELFTRIDRESDQGLADGRALIARYKEEPLRFFRDPRIAALHNSALSMAEELEDLRISVLALEQAARTQTLRAEALKLEGDRLHREARTALAQGNFDAARDSALQAGERYDASLAIQESPAIRRVRDADLIALGAEITRLENEATVREVRSLVNSARDAYFEGKFETAEEHLVRAMNRWRSLNPEEDPELSYWLTVVRGARSLRAGRVIPPTAPLYPEMSQLLNDARKNYEDGIRLINENRREEGLDRFVEARRKTREVRLMFPLNQEASLLELRMDQVMDPAAFNASFQRRLNEALAGAKGGSVESFADLQNLSEINSAYPGIRDLLIQAEIDVGYRPAPPDPRSLARSGELTATAQGIIDRNLRSQFPVALEQLNQALALDPSNSLAMSLKDRVQTELGGSGSAVLNSAAEREYQRAVQALQQGNTLVAMTIVRQLLQDDQNRNSRRILDLQRRIESIL